MSLQITISRVYEFSSAHRLHTSELSEKENIVIYDNCNNFNGHGHDYRLEVSLNGIPDKKTGMILSLNDFDTGVSNVLNKLDYKHLDKEVDFFKNNLSSGEIIVKYLWQELDKQFPKNMLYHLKLWETNNNYFECGQF
ncbi:MAG: 6-carboxytetrahydropterin synthase [Calditrichia bacterium]|nr:6-carboxytetrahydropterin synthase [Calditrichia bacterium]